MDYKYALFHLTRGGWARRQVWPVGVFVGDLQHKDTLCGRSYPQFSMGKSAGDGHLVTLKENWMPTSEDLHASDWESMWAGKYGKQ